MKTHVLSMFFAAMVGLAISAQWARASDFLVNLNVSAGTAKQTAASSKPPTRPTDVRPVLHAKLSEGCSASFRIAHIGKAPVADGLVHFYVVRLEKSGQAPPPLDPKCVVIETAQVMDFSEASKTSAELSFKPREPGVYLVRVEVEGSEKGDETSADLDLIVE